MIYFDFSNLYKREYNKRLVNFSLYNFLDQNEYSLTSFIELISSVNRDYKIICMGKYEMYFIFIEEFNMCIKARLDNNVFVVMDMFSISIRNDKAILVNFKMGIYNENRKCSSDSNEIKHIVNNVFNTFDYRCSEFCDKWNEYLEFEKRFFKEKLAFYKTDSYALKQVYQIKRDLDAILEYSDCIYFDDLNNYLYLDKYVEGSNKYYVLEFICSVSNSEDSYLKLNNFTYQEIEIANEKLALKDNKLVSKKELEFDFKTSKLGAILKPLTLIGKTEDRAIYSFSKFYNDEESYYSENQIREYIDNNYGDKPLLVNILTGDIALYKRGKQALEALEVGDVYNPYIPRYLFNFNEIRLDNIIDKQDIKFSNPNLDEYQKEAIYLSLNSNSLFLLQGPPGTGKTQTISELVYQYNKANKKVLISSQTHVAIDNVLERLPNELNILPIRLVSSERKSKVDSLYLPNRVVDNLYYKLKNKYLEKEYLLEKDENEYKSLLKEYEEIKKILEKNKDIRKEYLNSYLSIDKINLDISELDSKITYLDFKINSDKGILKFINDFRNNNYLYGEYAFNDFKIELLPNFNNIINKYNLDKYLVSDNLVAYLRLFDKLFKDNVIFNSDYNVLIKEFDFDEYSLNLDKNINKMNLELNILKEKKEYKINEKNKLELEIRNRYSSKIDNFNRVKSYYDLMFNKIIFTSFIPSSDEDKLDYIYNYLITRKKDSDKNKKEYENFKNIYKGVVSYIDEDLINNDKKLYTRYLNANNSNVYALTCNASSIYLKENNNYLKEFNTNDINLKDIDFDVVIIDEVSKASDMELLIPLIYAKTVILVGDQRQLPPLFKYKESMFDEFSVSKKVSKETLNKYEEMVETSLFKKLFNQTNTNKYMLAKQYRSHEEIMNIVNVFYDNKLVMGDKLINNSKEHNIEIVSNDLYLLTKDVHTMFINSHYDKNNEVSYEKKLVKGSSVSSSFYNESEIDITKNLLTLLDKDCVNNKGINVGVICLYKDQVNLLKKEVSKMKFTNIDFNKSRVNSVDEFQGREEDIIIVNLVRNNKNKVASEFIKKYERINVSLSRARKLLIIIGSKEFYNSIEVNIESLDSLKEVKRKIYKEIYDKVSLRIDNPYSYFRRDYNED